MYKIMIIEDDSVIANTLASQLVSWGYQVEQAEDFHDIMHQFIAFAPHLVLLDISLPVFNGYHWCEMIRKVSKVPIIFISSADENMNIIMTINLGADDFIAKPFDINVLIAKAQALLRRTYEFETNCDMIEHKGVILNTANALLSYAGQEVELTKNEYRILHLLLINKGRTTSRENLMAYLWQSDSYIDDNTLTVNINRLRKKLDQLGLSDFITTQKGLGYLIK